MIIYCVKIHIIGLSASHCVQHFLNYSQFFIVKLVLLFEQGFGPVDVTNVLGLDFTLALDFWMSDERVGGLYV